jgi:hypothetical protein
MKTSIYPAKSTTQAPFSEDQIRKLIDWQNAGYVHELTCRNNNERGKIHLKLEPMRDGLYCRTCGLTQTWVPSVCFSLPPNPFKILEP